MVWIWVAFICFVLVMLALDLGVFHRQAHVVSMKEALLWSLVWVLMGLVSPQSFTTGTSTAGWAWGCPLTRWMNK